MSFVIADHCGGVSHFNHRDGARPLKQTPRLGYYLHTDMRCIMIYERQRGQYEGHNTPLGRHNYLDLKDAVSMVVKGCIQA